MATRLYMLNPQTKEVKDVKIGLHWCGMMFPLFKGCSSFGMFITHYFWPFGTSKKIVKYLINKGFIFKSVSDGKPKELIEQKLGFPIPS